MCYQSLFKWWRHLHFLQNNSERQFEHRKFDAKSSSPKLLNEILRYYIQIVLVFQFMNRFHYKYKFISHRFFLKFFTELTKEMKFQVFI